MTGRATDKAFETLEKMAIKLCRAWDRELFDTMCDIAYANGINMSWDENIIGLEDEVFYLAYNLNEA